MLQQQKVYQITWNEQNATIADSRHCWVMGGCCRWLCVAAVGWSCRRNLDREPELRTGWHQEVDAGQRWSYSDGAELQNCVWSAQHRQRVSCYGLSQWNGLHQLFSSWLETTTSGISSVVKLLLSAMIWDFSFECHSICPSVLFSCWFGDRKNIRIVKTCCIPIAIWGFCLTWVTPEKWASETKFSDDGVVVVVVVVVIMIIVVV